MISHSQLFGFVLALVVCAQSHMLFAAEGEEKRVVNSKQERERLLGWDKHQKEKKTLDKERLSDVKKVEEKREGFRKEQERDLVEYRKEKVRKKAKMDDSGKLYKENLKEKVDAYLEREKIREKYVDERSRQRKLGRSTVNLTENEELGLVEKRGRVDWDKRDVLAEKDKGSKSVPAPAPSRGFSPPSPGRGNSDFIPPEFDSPPPPPPGMVPPPEFFEPDMPPGGEPFDLPPPPLPLDEGGVPPPPIFEDEF